MAIVSFLVTFAVLSGTSAGYAFWGSSQTVTSTVTAADLTLSTTNFTSVNFTFGNEALTTTGSVTATNSTSSPSTQAASVSLTFSQSGTSTLAGKVTRVLWTTGSAANCTASATAPGTATSALWSTTTTVTSSLAPGASAIYCVRSSIASRESVAVGGGTMTFTPQIAGTIALANFSGSASASASQVTKYIYPAVTPDLTRFWMLRASSGYMWFSRCLDLNGATASGSQVLTSTCSQLSVATSEHWKFASSGVTGYLTLQPRTASSLRLDDNSSSTSGAGLTVVTAGNSSTSLNQLWQVQQVSSTLYQLVNAYSGMCLTSAQSGWDVGGQSTQVPCNGGGTQLFSLSQTVENLACTASTNYVWSWTATTTGPYTIYVGGTAVGSTTTATANSLTVPASTIPPYSGQFTNWTMSDGNGTQVAVGQLTTGSPGTCKVYQ